MNKLKIFNIPTLSNEIVKKIKIKSLMKRKSIWKT